jgi:uncharacterized protein (DUF2141 family)
MKKTGLFFYIALLSVGIISVISNTGCANIIPPTGGLKDSLPPKLIEVSPPDRTLHFKENRIIFNFDEYLEIKDPRQSVIISPVPKQEPEITSKLKTITVKWRDTLRPNTTYALNFGNSIHDINEGNILRNFTYIFSTGSYIDSMQFSGKVILASSGKTDSTLIVMLHDQLDDSAVYKERPRYITTLDSSGRFTFRNLQPGKYAVYALKDESGIRKYTSKTMLFAFADSPVQVRQNTSPVTLFAFADTTGSKQVKKTTGTKSGDLSLAPQPKKSKEKEKRLIVQLNIAGGQLDLLTKLEMQFATPLKFFDSSKIRFTDEKFKDIDSSKYHYEKDTTGKKITLLYKWTSGTQYHLIADKEFAEDTLGNKLLKTDTISFQTKKESDYGSIRLRFTNLDLGRNPVLQFVQGDAVKFSRPLTTKVFSEKLVQPGDYELRILYDENKNGIWDPGIFFEEHKQPEKVQTLRTNRAKNMFTVKSNWDNESDIVL